MDKSELANESFAYPSMRKYPFHTKRAALKSAADFIRDEASYGPELGGEIRARLEKAAAYHGFTMPSLQKTAAAAVEAETVTCPGVHGVIKMTKISCSEDIDRAADFIIVKRASMHRNELENAAKYVTWCAANSDLDMNNPRLRKVARIAGIGVGDREAIEHEFDKRATVIPLGNADRDAFWAYSRDMHGLSDEDFYEPENLKKIAEVMDEMDDNYSGDMGDPEDTVFADSVDDVTKEAEDLVTIPSIDTTVSKEALMERYGRVKEFLNSYLGKDFSDSEDAENEIIDTIKGMDADTAKQFIKEIDA